MEIEAITGWLWSLRTPIVRAYAVRQDDGFNLIDTSTAGNEDAILEALAGVAGGEARIHDIFLTHAHSDHVGSAAALVERTGARVLAPSGEVGFIRREAELPPPQLLDWEVPIYEQVTPQVPEAPAVDVDLGVEDGRTLDWNEPAVVVAAPGHTPAGVALHFAKARVLVAGDAVATHEGEPIVGVFNADPDGALESFRQLMSLDVDIVCVGHGDPARR